MSDLPAKVAGPAGAATSIPLDLWQEAKLSLTEEICETFGPILGVAPDTLWQFPHLGAHEGNLALPIEKEGKVVALHVLTKEGKAYTYPKTKLTPLVVGHLPITEVIHVFSSARHYLQVMAKVEGVLGFPATVEFPATVIVDRGGVRRSKDAMPDEVSESVDIFDMIQPAQHKAVVWKSEEHGEWADAIIKRLVQNDIWVVGFVNGGDHGEALRNAQQVRTAPLIDPDYDATFPSGALPLLLRRMVRDYERVHVCPPIMPLLVALSCVSGSTFARVRLKRGKGYTHSNIYSLIIVPSAGGKSVVGGEIGEPIRRFNSSLIAKHAEQVKKDKKAMPALEQDKEIVKLMRRKAKMDAGSVAAPTPCLDEALADVEEKIQEIKHREKWKPNFVVTDFTSAGLEKKLSGAVGESLFGFHTDGRKIVLITFKGLFSKTSTPDDSLLIQGWSGDHLDSIRAGRDEENVNEPRLSVCWLTQSDQTGKIVNEESVKGGLLPRFQFCLMDQGIKQMGLELDPMIQANWSGFSTDLLRFCHRLAERGEYLDLIGSEEVMEVFRTFSTRIEAEIESETNLAGASNFARRWPEKAMRIALLLHLLHQDSGIMAAFAKAAKEAGPTVRISCSIPASMKTMSVETAKAAVELTLWLARQELFLLAPYLAGEAKVREDKVMENCRSGGA